jgi:hypothetical protein
VNADTQERIALLRDALGRADSLDDRYRVELDRLRGRQR